MIYNFFSILWALALLSSWFYLKHKGSMCLIFLLLLVLLVSYSRNRYLVKVLKIYD
jgi:hypothetical protein